MSIDLGEKFYQRGLFDPAMLPAFRKLGFGYGGTVSANRRPQSTVSSSASQPRSRQHFQSGDPTHLVDAIMQMDISSDVKDPLGVPGPSTPLPSRTSPTNLVLKGTPVFGKKQEKRWVQTYARRILCSEFYNSVLLLRLPKSPLGYRPSSRCCTVATHCPGLSLGVSEMLKSSTRKCSQ